jgi:hypothetical protein
MASFGVIAEVPAEATMIIQQFKVLANASGQYVITFTSVTNNTLISGIEID